MLGDVSVASFQSQATPATQNREPVTALTSQIDSFLPSAVLTPPLTASCGNPTAMAAGEFNHGDTVTAPADSMATHELQKSQPLQVNAASNEPLKVSRWMSSPSPPVQGVNNFPSAEHQLGNSQVAPIVAGRPSTTSLSSATALKSPADCAPRKKETEQLLKFPFVVVKNFRDGLECINGTYIHGPFYCNRPTFVKDTGGNPFCLYYRLVSDGSSDIAGWWFGPSIFSDGVWAHHTSASFLPPERNWSAPSCAGGEISHQNPSGPRVYTVKSAERALELGVEVPPESQVAIPEPTSGPRQDPDSPRLRLSLSSHVTRPLAAKQAAAQHSHDPSRYSLVPPRAPTLAIAVSTSSHACASSHHALDRCSPPHSAVPLAHSKATSSRAIPGVHALPSLSQCLTPATGGFQPPSPCHAGPFQNGTRAVPSRPPHSMSQETPRDSETVPRRPPKRRRRRGRFESDDDSNGTLSPRPGTDSASHPPRASATGHPATSKYATPRLSSCPRFKGSNVAHNITPCDAQSDPHAAGCDASRPELRGRQPWDVPTAMCTTAAVSASVGDDGTTNSRAHGAATASRHKPPSLAEIIERTTSSSAHTAARSRPMSSFADVLDRATASSSHEPAGLGVGASVPSSDGRRGHKDIDTEHDDWMLAQAMLQSGVLDNPVVNNANSQRRTKKRPSKKAKTAPQEVICVNSDGSSDDDVRPPPPPPRPPPRERKRKRPLKRAPVRDHAVTRDPSSQPDAPATTPPREEASQALALGPVAEEATLKCWACRSSMHITHNFCVSCGKPRNKDDDQQKAADKECVVCLDAPRSCVFNPCGHFACCAPCSRKFKKQQCPICRKKVSTVLRLFDA